MPHCDRPKVVEKSISDVSKSIGGCLTIAETASQLERQLVHSVYEEIAGHFSDTRHKPWPRVAEFIRSDLDVVNRGRKLKTIVNRVQQS